MIILLALALMVILFVALPLVGMALWALLSVVVVGLIIGGLGRLVVPGRQRIGVLGTVASGLSGSILGGFIGQHVLSTGRILTVLLEVGIAAVVVVGLVGFQRRFEHSGSQMAGPSWLSTDRRSSGGHWR
ncbi:MAG: hypothetical protein J2P58_13785 [Acidimicrobiaceae bacterium]|nr:hypothetical protein [Acidimicrobiaceae bacterium]